MTALNWDAAARTYSDGVSQGVLYLPSQAGVAWNGLVSVDEQKQGDTITRLYVDGRNYGTISYGDDFALAISAYTCPDAFFDYTGYGGIFDDQPQKSFGFSYKTGDLIHLVYNVTAQATSRAYSTDAKAPSLSLFTWDFNTVPDRSQAVRPTAHFIIDTTVTYAPVLTAVTNALYGTASTAPYLPPIATILQMYVDNAILQVTDNGDGTWTASSTDPSTIQMLDSTTFQITAKTAIPIDSVSYTISTDY